MKINSSYNCSFKGQVTVNSPIKTTYSRNWLTGQRKTTSIIEFSYYPFKDETAEKAKKVVEKIKNRFTKKIVNGKTSLEIKCKPSGIYAPLPYTEDEMKKYVDKFMSVNEKRELIGDIIDDTCTPDCLIKRSSQLVWTKDN